MLNNEIHNIYLIGIGGIGMSALARYYKHLGKNVAGYDRTSTDLTIALETEGINIHFEDNLKQIPSTFTDPSQKDKTLIIYTPAVPSDHAELTYFKNSGFVIKKRSEVLGLIIQNKKGIAVAGTHGKTTVSTMIAHILKNSSVDCNAFLGGISKNYNTNLLLSDSNENVVVEADEYDRSFLQLNPQIAVITAVDADHLDIYGNIEELRKAFTQFTSKIQKGGTLVVKSGINILLYNGHFYHKYTYSLNSDTDFYARNIRVENHRYIFDLVTPLGNNIKNITLGIPGLVNVENAVAALAVGYINGVSENDLRLAMLTFEGCKRRFDVQIDSNLIVYIDDYAHHPEELKACINSVKELYPDKKITGIFQPHLFSRTRDLAEEFAVSLSLLDEVVLLDIYPARELPIKNISSEIIFKNITQKNKTLCTKEQLLEVMKKKKPEVLITMGAGDIDRFVEPLKKMYS